VNNWIKLCEYIKPLIDGNVGEDVIHRSFELWLRDFFNWDGTSLKHEERVPMGSNEIKRADIALYGSDFGIVIEMKAPRVSIGNKEIDQLNSYMRILRCRYGFLVGNKLKMFYDDGKPGEMVKEVADIDFVPGNRGGVELGEILDKSACSDEKLKEYAERRKDTKKVCPTSDPTDDSNPDPADPDPHTKLKNVWNYWNQKYSEYPAEEIWENPRDGNVGSVIPIDNWPEKFYYEFVILGNRQKDIRINFYDTALPLYDKIEAKLKSDLMSKGITEIAGEPIIDAEFYHPTKNNHGRVELFIPLSKGREYVCECMKELIDKTQGAITELIRQTQG
jgi:hypothetical protein